MSMYANTSTDRPSQSKPGGCGIYCCIPQCGSSQYGNQINKTNIALFSFPNKEKNPDIYKSWCQEIHKFRRKGGKDAFKITKNTKVCEFHFKPEEIKISIGRGIKSLKTGFEVPSIYPFKKSFTTPLRTRRSPRKRLPLDLEKLNNQSSTNDEIDMVIDANNQGTPEELNTSENTCLCQNCIELQIQINYLQSKIDNLISENIELKSENDNLKIINKDFSNRMFTYENLSKDEEKFRSATGIEVEKFNILYNYLEPGEFCENIKFYNKNQANVDEKISANTFASPSFFSPESKPGPKPKLKAIDQLFMYLTWLRLGFTLTHTAWLFSTPKSTVSRYIITWSNYLYLKLGSIPIWPSKSECYTSMPQVFKDTYPSTRVIIDCTELFCQRPSSLTIQSSLFSHYKHHVTYKGLVGIAPSGGITFVSELYDGSISDVEIVKRCGILQKELWSDSDSLMADRGFTIQNLLKPLGVSLNIPAFLQGREQLTMEEVTESQTIAAVRIHVERAIQRVKKFRQIRNEIPLVLHGSINQIWTISCLLCNFMPPLIK